MSIYLDVHEDSVNHCLLNRNADEVEEQNDEIKEPVIGQLLDGVDARYSDVLRFLATDQIMHFDTLAKLLPARSEDELLDALKHVAVHVRGRLMPTRLVICSTVIGISKG